MGLQIGDPGVLRKRGTLLNIDCDHAPPADPIEHRGHEQGASAPEGAGLDDHIRVQIEDNLLVDPEIEGALIRRESPPIGVIPDAGVVVKTVESGHRFRISYIGYRRHQLRAFRNTRPARSPSARAPMLNGTIGSVYLCRSG